MGRLNFCLMLPASILVIFAPLSIADDIKFTGYGSAVAGTVVGGDEEPFVVDPLNPTGGQYDDEIRFEPESVIALRAKTDINEQLSATLQVTGKGGSSNDAQFEWAYLSYHLTPETDINAGRFRLPLFYYSDFLDAAYAYYWIRPPADVYNIQTSTVTGVNVINTSYFDKLGVTTQAWYGAQRTEFSDITAELNDSLGITVMLEYDIFRVRANYQKLKLGLDLEPFFVPTPGGLVPVDPPPTETDISYSALAFMVDFGSSLLWRSEFTRTDVDSATEPSNSAYASIGYAIGDFTPHYTYSYTDGVEEYKTHTVGVRWDLMPKAALKMEYSNIDYESDGGMAPAGPVSAREYQTGVIAVALDFVF